MFHFLQKKILKKICNKGTINVLQGGGVSGVWSKTILLHFFWTLSLLPCEYRDYPYIFRKLHRCTAHCTVHPTTLQLLPTITKAATPPTPAPGPVHGPG